MTQQFDARGPTLVTERLVLRLPRAEDFDAWAAFDADAEVSRHLGGVKPRPVSWRSMATMAGSWMLNGFGMFSVLEKDSGAWIGRIGPWSPDGWPGTEIGWGLARSAWGKGYAAEAAAATMDFAVDRLGWTDIIHTIAPENGASQGLARRLGSANRGPVRLPAPYESLAVDVWGQTAEQWRARRGR
jgi:RimJ/RimL family protein N-acetyltransferase